GGNNLSRWRRSGVGCSAENDRPTRGARMNRFVKVLLSAVVLGTGSARLWLSGATAMAAAEPKEQATLKGHTDQVFSVVYSQDGKSLASASGNEIESGDNTIRLWDVKTGKELATFKGHRSAVLSVVYNPDGKSLASASADKTIKLWDLQGKELATFKGHKAK